MSISGWRKIFSHDEDPENNDKKLSLADKYFVILVAYHLKNFFLQQKASREIVLARDSRPTGLAIQTILAKTFSLYELPYVNLNVLCLPQVLALVKKQFSGFVYITASHNPVGYNGFKIGEGNGEVLAEEKSSKLITSFKGLFFDSHETSKVINLYFNSSSRFLARKINLQNKAATSSAELAYNDLINQVNSQGNELILKKIREIPQQKIVCDFNGSSRLKSADKLIFAFNNIKLVALNKKLGFFNHQIVPEGDGLNDLKKYLLTHSQQNILWGYAVDCDGDRGNFAFYKSPSQVIVPNAQSIFSLMVLSELVFLKLFFGEMKKKCLIVNGPTTLNVEKIASLFDTKVFRAEVGEINVLELGKIKRREGYFVRIMGEGSNGGSIIAPSTVRDPLATCFSFYKLLFLSKNGISLKEEAVKILQLPQKLLGLDDRFFLAHLMEKIAFYHSSSLFEKKALVVVDGEISQSKLKENYVVLFQKEFLLQGKWFRKLGFVKYEFVNYEGTETKIGPYNRSKNASGGLKAMFYNEGREKQGFVWFRGSKTEPVFRISAEIKGKKSDLTKLLNFQRRLLKKAAAKNLLNYN